MSGPVFAARNDMRTTHFLRHLRRRKHHASRECKADKNTFAARKKLRSRALSRAGDRLMENSTGS